MLMLIDNALCVIRRAMIVLASEDTVRSGRSCRWPGSAPC